MKSTTEYLPEKSEVSARVAAALDGYINNLYLVGSAARKYCYGLSANTNGFDFVLDGNADDDYPLVHDLFVLVGEGKASTTAYYKHCYDFDSFDLTLRVMPIADFLVTVPYAGDGLVIQCKTGRPIVLPEYMNLRPTMQIRTFKDGEVDDTWKAQHIETLTTFENEITELMAKHVEASTTK